MHLAACKLICSPGSGIDTKENSGFAGNSLILTQQATGKIQHPNAFHVVATPKHAFGGAAVPLLTEVRFGAKLRHDTGQHLSCMSNDGLLSERLLC